MQFLVIAYDGTDNEAAGRRLAARPAHLAGACNMKAKGHFLEGGAILNDAGEMIGSMMLMEFESRELLNEWLNADPYITGGVWRSVQVLPFRKAPI
jgi:uncharacterized protein YciI